MDQRDSRDEVFWGDLLREKDAFSIGRQGEEYWRQ